MKKKSKLIQGIIILLCLILLIIIVSKTFPLQKKSTPFQPEPSLQEIEKHYRPFSDQTLKSFENKKRVLYFYSSWDSQSKLVNKDIVRNVKKLPSDTMILRVDFNDPDQDRSEIDLAKKHGVTKQNIFVQIDSQGSEVAKWNARNMNEILSKLK